MVLKSLVAALSSAALLVAASAAMADEYRPDEFLGMDLSKAVLSPKPLGPPTQFAPIAVEAKGDRNSEVNWAREDLKTEPKKVAVETVRMTRPHRIARAASIRDTHAASVKRAPTRLAPRHANPLDAKAMDTRIQKWPCRSGAGICDWKQ